MPCTAQTKNIWQAPVGDFPRVADFPGMQKGPGWCSSHCSCHLQHGSRTWQRGQGTPATQATAPGSTAWQSYGEPGGWISSQTLTTFSKQSPKPALNCVGNFEDERNCLLSKLCSQLGCPQDAAAKFLVSSMNAGG